MNIYIEGPDATGKTTLAEWLCAEFGFTYEHLTAESPNTLEHHQLLMMQDRKVYDRFCLGEVVYSDIYGREPKLTLTDCVHLLQKAEEQDDIFVVLVTSNLELLKARLRERNELNYLDEIEAQNKKYIELCYALKAVDYPYFIVYDIADGYVKLYDFLRKELSDAQV